jgi:hypothetical protein
MLGGRRAVEGPIAFKDKVEKIHLLRNANRPSHYELAGISSLLWNDQE